MGADVDVLHAQAAQPVGVDPLEVDVPLLILPGHKRIGLMAQGVPHGGGNILVGLKAAGADGGAYGTQYVFRLCAEGVVHFKGGFCRQTHGCPTPTGVDGTNGVVHGVIEQNCAAVGGKHHQGEARAVGDEGIYIRIVPGDKKSLAGILLRDQTDVLRVGLLGQDRTVLSGLTPTAVQNRR